MKTILTALYTCAALTLFAADTPELPLAELPMMREKLWQEHVKNVRADAARQKEHAEKSLAFSGKTMRYAYTIVGEKPASGRALFIALHGGGSGPAAMNDQQWQHMQRYYLAGVKEGVYLATRSIDNAWNEHFLAESYTLYERLIENMAAFEDVDQNRVYVMGYSAGGDGVYQIAPRLADRLAAANMSAGHHNGCSPRNLYNLPFLIQVGELDGAFDRNKEAVRYFQKLTALRAKENGAGYIAALNVHVKRPHNFADFMPYAAKQAVLADPVAWLERGDHETAVRNTDAVSWLTAHTRTPLPEKVVWDLATQSDRSGVDSGGKSLWGAARAQNFYWLRIARNIASKPGDEIVVRFDKAANAFHVSAAAVDFEILLSSAMVDFARPITVTSDGAKIFDAVVKPTEACARQTLSERGDRACIFEARLHLSRSNGKWRIGDTE